MLWKNKIVLDKFHMKDLVFHWLLSEVVEN